MRLLFNCLNCKKDYFRYESETKKGSSFCSLICKNQYRSFDRICQHCESQFRVYRSNIKVRGGKYCSVKCFRAAQQQRILDRKITSLSRSTHKKHFSERFFKKISFESHPKDCWIWTGLCNKAGYGRLRVDNKDKFAHRLSWEFHIGNIPDGLFVCHKCDNPPCCNPDHLFLGTAGDNTRDMVAKGRRRDDKGENHPMAKLTNHQVIEIRKKLSDGQAIDLISLEYNVSEAAITNIKLRKSWSHI